MTDDEALDHKNLERGLDHLQGMVTGDSSSPSVTGIDHFAKRTYCGGMDTAIRMV
jgi:hypothetical protein